MWKWIAENHIGDWASLAGVAIAIVGFVVTVVNVMRSKSAAERAEAAANEARRMMRAYQTVSDLSAAIAIMEEIKRLHRLGQIDPLLDRYGALRRALIRVRKMAPALSESMQTQIQSAIMTLSTIEGIVERARAEGSSPDIVELNRWLSMEIDSLYSVLIGITITIEEKT
jgi:hypothetical protein